MDVKRRNQISGTLGSFARKCIFSILSIGEIPNHIAFIMDGNRRYTKQHNLMGEVGHRIGFSTLMLMLRYCYELGVKYVTIYAFSIENFKRSPQEVQSLMDLMEEKIEGLIKEESIVNQYGIRVYFIGNLSLLSKPVRLAAQRAMDITAKNSKAVLSVCIAYTSSDEILHAVRESCEEKWNEIEVLDDRDRGLIEFGGKETKKEKNAKSCEEKWDENEVLDDGDRGLIEFGGKETKKEKNANSCEEKWDENKVLDDGDRGLIEFGGKDSKFGKNMIDVSDIKRHMHMAVAPDPDIIIRTSGETRLSNFLLWQSTNCLLYSPSVLWPEIGFRHLVQAVLDFQKHFYYLKRQKQT